MVGDDFNEGLYIDRHGLHRLHLHLQGKGRIGSQTRSHNNKHSSSDGIHEKGTPAFVLLNYKTDPLNSPTSIKCSGNGSNALCSVRQNLYSWRDVSPHTTLFISQLSVQYPRNQRQQDNNSSQETGDAQDHQLHFGILLRRKLAQ
jgi:hypothetical protein